MDDFIPLKEMLASDDPRMLLADYFKEDTIKCLKEYMRAEISNPHLIKAALADDLISFTIDFFP